MSLTLYVAPDGSDFNSGTFAQPLETVQEALNLLPPGQGGTILLRGGSYQLEDTILIDDFMGGTVENPLTIRNYENETVLLDGSSLADFGGSGILLFSTSYVEIEGLEIFGADTGIILLGETNDVLIRNNVVRDIQRAGIAAYSPEQQVIQDIRIDGNTVYRTNLFNSNRPIIQPGGWGSGIVFSRTEGGEITNNTVYENYGEGIAVTLANNAIASNNTVYDNFSVQMYLDNTTNTVFEENFIFNTGDTDFYRRYDFGFGEIELAASGIQLANELYRDANPIRNNVIRNNVIVGGDAALSYSDYQNGGGLQDTLVANNTFYANGTTQWLLTIPEDGHSGNRFTNNIFYTEFEDQAVNLPFDLEGLDFSTNLWFGSDPGSAASDTDIYTDPLFVAPGLIDVEGYRIQASSNAIDAGAVIDFVTEDFTGLTRSGLLDIGAYEFIPPFDDPITPLEPIADDPTDEIVSPDNDASDPGALTEIPDLGNGPMPFEPLPFLPADTFVYNGNRYRLTDAAVSWTEAQAEAELLGGNLVTINDAAESEWIRDTFGSVEFFWIGLNDQNVEGVFEWASGETVDYLNWTIGEPNNFSNPGAPPTGEDYVLMNWRSSGEWNDLPNDFSGVFRGVIELPGVELLI